MLQPYHRQRIQGILRSFNINSHVLYPYCLLWVKMHLQLTQLAVLHEDKANHTQGLPMLDDLYNEYLMLDFHRRRHALKTVTTAVPSTLIHRFFLTPNGTGRIAVRLQNLNQFSSGNGYNCSIRTIATSSRFKSRRFSNKS
jgi:hypothetical protein